MRLQEAQLGSLVAAAFEVTAVRGAPVLPHVEAQVAAILGAEVTRATAELSLLGVDHLQGGGGREKGTKQSQPILVPLDPRQRLRH